MDRDRKGIGILQAFLSYAQRGFFDADKEVMK